MALPAILPRATFADELQVEDVQFVQEHNQQQSMTSGGEAYSADRAPSLWRAECTTGPMTHAEAEGLMALINSRAGGIKTFLLFNHKLPFPSSDPTGSIIGATVPTLNVIANRLNTSFSGFPAGYVIPRGTYFGIVWDSSRYYLGQFAEARTANPITGAVASTEIWPPLPTGIDSGASVVIAKPCAKFKIVTGTAFPSTVGSLHSRVQFTARQTYAA